MRKTCVRWPTVLLLILVCILARSVKAQEPAEPITVAQPLTDTVIYSDSLGLSHFADHQVEFELVDYAPPAPPISVSDVTGVDGFVYISSPVGWFGDWHPAPRRQMIYCLSGEIEAEVSDGEDRAYLLAVPIPKRSREHLWQGYLVSAQHKSVSPRTSPYEMSQC